MLSALISFLGGSVFRMLWGEISAYLNKKQDHQFEIERMRLQGELEAAQHGRNMESIKTQAALQIEVVRVQGEQAVSEKEADAWLEAVKATGRAIGVAWVDAWNAAIRPGLATWAVVMLTLEAFALATISGGTAEVCAAALGIFVADRSLMRRGK